MKPGAEKNIQLQVNRLRNLPALAEASVSILEAINSPDISIDELTETLSLSPGLVARLLGLANSAYFGQSREIVDLRTAIFQVLGLQLVKSLTLGIVMNVHLDSKACLHFDSHEFWLRSLLTAFAGQWLARERHLPEYAPAVIYNAGLLSEIGILTLAALFPAQLDSVLVKVKNDLTVNLNDAIRKEFGVSHYLLGHQLLCQWRLPVVYQAVLENFESTDAQGMLARLLCLLRVSQAAATAVVENRPVEPERSLWMAAQAMLPVNSVEQLMHDLLDRKQNIEQLAMMMGK